MGSWRQEFGLWSEFGLFNKKKCRKKPLYVEPDTSKSITPTKAFWQSRKSEKFDVCKACVPFIAIDKIFGELTCRICGHQTYREKAMKKHIEKNHDKPPHTCGKPEDSDEKPNHTAMINKSSTIMIQKQEWTLKKLWRRILSQKLRKQKR